MKKILFAFLSLCPFIFLANACSESSKVSGGTIEDENAISEQQLKEWYNFGIGRKDVVLTKLDGGEFAAMIDGTGARAECSANKIRMTMTMQIYESSAIKTFNAINFNERCDSVFASFKQNCSLSDGSKFYSLSNSCSDGAFDAACQMNNSIPSNLILADFESEAASNCTAIAKDAQNSTGTFETATSSSSSFNKASSSSYANDKLSYSEPEILYGRTLENYVLLFTDNQETFSFDKQVIAYNGTPSASCTDFVYHTTGLSTTELYKQIPIIPANESGISLCFPMTDKILKNHHANDDKCDFFMTFISDGSQPIGHILNRISETEFKFIAIEPSGECTFINKFSSVFFLIQNCSNNENVSNPQSILTTIKSEKWKCDEPKTSPAEGVIPYGEWFSSSLIDDNK